uniref:Uncharacterized protein n=1 Tax=Rhizophora mucronata TaxID=61149 RepID=A0A2P2QMX4_RHIMU
MSPIGYHVPPGKTRSLLASETEFSRFFINLFCFSFLHLHL